MWTDRISAKVVAVKDSKHATICKYEDQYDTLQPVGTTLQNEKIDIAFRYGKWRKEYSYKDIDGVHKKTDKIDIIFGLRDGYYDLSM